jgi:copper chaperone for superoxide dismutase
LGGRSGYSINNLIKGVIRFIEIPDGCIIDGIVKGLSAGEHGMHIHEYGDITNGCKR